MEKSLFQNAMEKKTATFIATYLTTALNIRKTQNPEDFTDLTEVKPNKLLKHMLSCNTREELYELLEDYSSPDPITEMILTLIDLK